MIHLLGLFLLSKLSVEGEAPGTTTCSYFAKLGIYLGLVYTISDYFSCRIAFLNPVQKTLQSMRVYKKPGKQPSDTISSTKGIFYSAIFIVFFASLPSNTPLRKVPRYFQSVLQIEALLFRLGSKFIQERYQRF